MSPKVETIQFLPAVNLLEVVSEFSYLIGSRLCNVLILASPKTCRAAPDPVCLKC